MTDTDRSPQGAAAQEPPSGLTGYEAGIERAAEYVREISITGEAVALDSLASAILELRPPSGLTPPRACVVAIARDDRGRLLLGRRLKRDTGYGKWVLPGGGIHGRETFEQALQREVREECGIAVDVGALAVAYRHIEGPTNNVALFFHCTASGSPTGGDDLGEPRFFTEEEVAALDVTTATKEVLALARGLTPDVERVVRAAREALNFYWPLDAHGEPTEFPEREDPYWGAKADALRAALAALARLRPPTESTAGAAGREEKP